MSDWFRSFDPMGLLVFGITCLAWGGGGWLVARAWFTLHRGERLVVGLGIGFVIYLTLVNLLSPLTGLPLASLLNAGLVLVTGLAATWRSQVRWVNLRKDLHDVPQVIGLLLVALVFERALRGISLFDEYLQLPMISIMGIGDIPPRFYLNPDLTFAYHYALQVFSAVLENVPRFFPWSAWDLTRGLAIALTAGLGWLWGRRSARRSLAGTLAALLFVFGGGTRWLLLFLPGRVLVWVSQGLQLTNTGLSTGTNLIQALVSPWVIEGGGKVPFPFAFYNGVFIPQSFALSATGALPALTLLLLLLLSRSYPTWHRPGALAVLSLIFANLALSAEHMFVFLWISVALILVGVMLHAWRNHRAFDRGAVSGWAIILAISAVLSTFQGGYITETVRSLLYGWLGKGVAASNLYGFALRWPPAIPSAHLGQLSPFNLRQLVALLAEAGPVLLAAPFATLWAWRAARRGNWLAGGVGLSALLMILFALFVQYGVDRSSTRFAGTSLWLWLVLAFPTLWWIYRRGKSVQRAWLGLCCAAVLWSGLVLFAIQITATPAPVPTYFIEAIDLQMSRKYWNSLEPDAQVFDPHPERSVTLFGRASKTSSSIYEYLPEWEALLADPTPQKVAAAGFSYVYIDEHWWSKLSIALRQAYQQPCVRLVDEALYRNQFRWLEDVRGCK